MPDTAGPCPARPRAPARPGHESLLGPATGGFPLAGPTGPMPPVRVGMGRVLAQAVMASTRASAELTACSATCGPKAMPSTAMTSTSVMPMNPKAAFR